MDKVLLDLAEKLGEIDKIAKLVRCNDKNIDTLEEATNAFITNTVKRTPIKFFIIKLLQMCYEVDFSSLNKKTIYQLLYLVTLSRENIIKQYRLLKQLPQVYEEFDVVLNVSEKDLNRLLELFALFGTVLQKSQIIPTKELKEELLQWHEKNLSLHIHSNKSRESKEKDSKKGEFKKLFSIIALLATFGTLGTLLLYVIIKNILGYISH